MRVREYIEIIEQAAPLSGAYEWDNPGMMLGDPSLEVTGVLVCMDLTTQNIEEAAAFGASLIVTHHPVIFRPESTMREDRRVGRVLAAAARAGMAVYSAHTNLDVAEYGVNFQLARALELSGVERSGEFHIYGDLPRKMSVSELRSFIDEKLDTRCRCLSGEEEQYNEPPARIGRVGLSCGGWDDEFSWLAENGCDALITGEIKHSGAVDLAEFGVTAFVAGHYATEKPGIAALADILPGKVKLSEYRTGDGLLK